MGISTVTAGRILEGQLLGNNGEEQVTFMENLDHSALSKVGFDILIIKLFRYINILSYRPTILMRKRLIQQVQQLHFIQELKQELALLD